MSVFLSYQRLQYVYRNDQDNHVMYIIMLALPIILISPVMMMILCSLISSMMLGIRRKQSAGLMLLPISCRFELVNHYAFGFVLLFAAAWMDFLILLVVYVLSLPLVGDWTQHLHGVFACDLLNNVIVLSMTVCLYMINVMMMRMIHHIKKEKIVFMVFGLVMLGITFLLPRTTGIASLTAGMMMVSLVFCPCMSYVLERRKRGC